VTRALATQFGSVARRSVLRVMRQPATIVPALAFPMVLLAVNASGLDSATRLPGFPTDSYLTFALAFTFVQGGLFAVMRAGTDMALDVETGFLNRLALTPLRGAALVAGQVAGVVALGALQAVTFLSIGLLFGADLAAGPGGVAVLLALCLLLALGFGGIGAMVAFRTGSGEAVQGLFPVFFVFLFLSSMNLPRDLIEIDWFRTIATWNPVSYVIEALRSLMVTGWDLEALALGIGVVLAIVTLGLTGAAAALRTRLVRT
jgi:ABC-2 type transport system permease protein